MFNLERLRSLGLDDTVAKDLVTVCEDLLGDRGSDEAWFAFLDRCHSSALPFEVYQSFWEASAPTDLTGAAFRKVWRPDARVIDASNIAEVMRERGFEDYGSFHDWTSEAKTEFWQLVIDRLGIRFQRAGECVVRKSDDGRGADFFSGSSINITASCFQADPNTAAIRFRDFDGVDRVWTYSELQAKTVAIAKSLNAMGLSPGDRIAIDMPMTAESVAIYLAIVRGGMTVISIADSFAPDEIAARLRIAETRVVFTQDVLPRGGKVLPLYEKVVEAGATTVIVLPARDALQVDLRDGDRPWQSFLDIAKDAPDPGVCFADPDSATNILFSSGTTGEPKAIPWSHLTPIKAAMDGHFHQDIRSGDVVAWPTNLGWMMGPWLIYASLINRATIALYYGAPMDRGFGEFVADAKVTMLGTVPSVVKSWRKGRTMEGLDWSPIRTISSTGECSNADDYLYLMWLAGFKPVIEYCGGTELGGGYVASTVVQPSVLSAFSTATLGISLHLLDEAGEPADAGEVFLDAVSIGFSRTLLNRDHDQVYFEGCPTDERGRPLRRHGDELERVGDYYRALGRADDTMNLGGIKVGSAEIERVIACVSGVRDVAAVGVSPVGGGPSELVIFAAVSDDGIDLVELKSQMQRRIKDELNPLFKISRVDLLEQLPRTASNKVMRRLLRSQATVRPDQS